MIRHALLIVLAVGLPMLPVQAQSAKCLYISSYHQGYAWSDGVESGLRQNLAGHCEIRQFDMDTKRKKTVADKQQAALDAKAIIDSWQPDVVITSDDNAAKYLIQPYFKDAALPFVFCGVNWSVEEYGLPYTNTTGMIEVAPIVPMLQRALRLVGSDKGLLYIGADTITEKKNYRRVEKAAGVLQVQIKAIFANTPAQWLAAYKQGDSFNVMVLGSNAGIANWDKQQMTAATIEHARSLTVTNHKWMMPYAAYGLTKIAEEQGEWSALTAVAILAGTSPAEIPIVANRKWDEWINESIWKAIQLEIPRNIKRNAKRQD